MKSIDFNSIKRAAKDPRIAARVVLGTLLAANLVAALFAFRPWSGSAEDLAREASSLTRQAREKQATLQKMRNVVSKVQAARGDGDAFMDSYLLSSRTVSSRLVDELDATARKASIRQREYTVSFEPIEGSDTLSKATITAGYEGTYADLMQYLSLLDRSPRLLIIESLTATPQQGGATLSVSMKLNAFVREGAGSQPVQVASAGGGAQP